MSFTWKYWLNLVTLTLVPCSLLHFNFYMFCHTNSVLSKLLKLAKKDEWYKTKICRKEGKRCLHVPLTPFCFPLLFLYPQCLPQLYHQQDLPSTTVEQLWRFLQRRKGELHFFQAWHKHACHLLHWNASHNLISHINFISPVQAYSLNLAYLCAFCTLML